MPDEMPEASRLKNADIQKAVVHFGPGGHAYSLKSVSPGIAYHDNPGFGNSDCFRGRIKKTQRCFKRAVAAHMPKTRKNIKPPAQPPFQGRIHALNRHRIHAYAGHQCKIMFMTA